jgi:RNA polymerase sigma factor for flagellar operon FliA
MIDREATIRSLLPMVRRVARRVKRLVPGLDLDDLIGDGSIGLIRAVDGYDASRGPTLEQYARSLIAGAMLNGLRRMDPVSERARRIARCGENLRYKLAVTCGVVPTASEMERSNPGFVRALAATRRGQPLSLDAPLPEGERLRPDWSGDPAFIAEQRQTQRELAALIEGLPPRQRQLVLAHYFGERSLRGIGKSMAISPQRASQLHLAALSSMRRRADAAPH